MKYQLLIAAVILIACTSVVQAQADVDALKGTSWISNPTDKIRAIEDFLKNYPTSNVKSAAYRMLFSLYLDQSNEAGALRAADGYLRTLQQSSLPEWYNNFSFELADKGIGIDTALAYITRCEALLKATGSTMPAMYKDTYAFVLYKKGDAAKAVQIQREAVKGHEHDADYVSHLALFEEASGDRHTAITDMARAFYLSGDAASRAALMEWIGKEMPAPAKRTALTDSVVMATVHAFVDTLKQEALIAERSKAAAYMANLGVDLKTASAWANTAVKALSNDSPTEELVGRKENLAIVEVVLGHRAEALGLLKSVEDLATLWDTKFWQTLGDLYVQSGKPKEAKDAYLQGMLATQDGHLRQTLANVYGILKRSTDSIDADVASMKSKLQGFEPGRAPKRPHSTGKIVLAELFTGAECGPCAGADAAFDALSEYYPRSELAIVEYHEHIPGPDPMTTDATAARFQHYMGQGTPTVIIDGTEDIVGGGPRYIAKNRFGVFRHTIEKDAAKSPRASVKLNIAMKNGVAGVTVDIGALHKLGHSAKPYLHIALVERSVNYHGSNGVTNHLFVVRQLVDGADGIPLKNIEMSQTVNRDIDIADVEHSIQSYLDNPMAHPSWPHWLRSFSGWKERPDHLDRSNLAVVAWVQDAGTNVVLQTAYQDVPATSEGKTSSE